MAYLTLSTANLPDPAIDPAQGSSPADYFGTLLWTGNTDTGTRTITDATSGVTGEVNFTPDWVWTKSRSATGSHAIFDAVRGANEYLTSNGTGAEITDPSSGYLDSFTDGGFVAQEGSSNFANLNTNGTTYVAWNWKANGSGVSNTDGSITSTVSANTESGFSVVKYDGTGTAATVGHGLDQAPQLIFCKRLDRSGDDWKVYAEAIGGGTHQLTLNSTANASTNSAQWNDTDATSTVFSIGTSAATNGTNQIAYCFHSVDGFSKVSSYVGNGSTDGPFVYLGFRPSFVMLKRSDTTGTWQMLDSKRDTFNVTDEILVADSPAAEFTGTGTGGYLYDFTSNGFKVREDNSYTNASGGTYIYMAFAENPFKYSNAR